MTYRELLLQAELKLDHNEITLGEFEQMIAPLNREVDVLDKVRAEIEQINPWDFPRDERTAEHIKNMVLDIIDSYRKGAEE